MIKIRKSNQRGHIKQDWLNTFHTFSFGEYYDPEHTHFRSLRVINEDYIKPSSGFPFHSHQDMEILTYIISGELEHKDSLGNTSFIRRGEIQLMRAGSGITHSEYNSSIKDEVHLLQIWIFPSIRGLKPLYQQKSFELHNNMNQLQLIASPDGENNSFIIAQNAKVYAAIIDNTTILHTTNKEHGIWLQVVNGGLSVNNEALHSGDGAEITNESEIVISGHGEFVMFDLG